MSEEDADAYVRIVYHDKLLRVYVDPDGTGNPTKTTLLMLSTPNNGVLLNNWSNHFIKQQLRTVNSLANATSLHHA